MTMPASSQRRVPPRQGPRPLALHLANATGAWTSSRAALPLLKNGSLPWRPEFALQGGSLSLALAAGKNDTLDAALDTELTRRATLFLDGVERYRRHPYHRDLAEPPLLWQEGTTRLLDYRPRGGPPVLVVPSLINRAYILDLAPGQSLLRYLADRGLRPLLVDWGAPGEEERRFDVGDYIMRRLGPAAEVARQAAGGVSPVVLGYCMGGLLALALAARRPPLVSALALLATPWRFHAERAEQARLLGVLAEPIAKSYAALGEVPVDMLQALFAAQDPLLVLRKFSRFAEMAPDSAAALGFVALEDWLNDGVPLAIPVARECLGGWYGEDRPGRGRWLVDGQPIRPRDVEIPALVVVPAQDRIVPPATAAALSDALPQAETWRPNLGHIGMIVARDAPSTVWEPLAGWLGATG
ncbi:MAG TPA: alpha/beta fold hydrolase, partial [Stellaceae bacterium]|jgi:polyhydroxyalkanoate synthase